MITEIYVFSGTGTALSIATNLSKSLEDSGVFSIPHTMKNSRDKSIKIGSKNLGLIFPCYFGEMPNLVREFVSRLDLTNVRYVFSIVSAGGDQGYCLKFLDEELQKKGKKLNYGTSIVGASNYLISWYYRGVDLEKFLPIQKKKISIIANHIQKEIEQKDKSSYLMYKLPQLIYPKKLTKDTTQWDKDFSTNKNCTSCGICSKVCPVENIKMEGNKPTFTHNCQRCMACLQYCPQNAIEFRGKEINKPKYTHPDFPAGKLISFYENQSKLR